MKHSRPPDARGPAILTIAVLAALIYTALVPAVRAVTDADIFWHLATARWILDHGAFPTVDPFSRVGVELGARWIAYSWLFELPVYGLYRGFGWVGIVLYTAILGSAVTIALFSLIRSREPGLAASALLTFLAVLALWPILTPRPWLCTLLLFLIELRILLRVRASGSSRALWLLPPLFALWANLHIQFVYGLFLLGLFVLESSVLRLLRRADRGGAATEAGVPILPLLLAGAASALATLLNPYGWDLIRVIGKYVFEPPPPVQELTPPDFRNLPEWIVAALGAAALFGGVWRRKPFLLLLGAVGLAAFLHSRRDGWFSLALSITVLAETRPWPQSRRTGFRGLGSRPLSPAIVGISALAACGFLAAGGYAERFRNTWHEARQADVLPAGAVEFIRDGSNGESAPPAGSEPLFNSFDWGGYLIWSLPGIPVALDGRTNLHGPERLRRAWTTLDGLSGWDGNPEFREARLILIESHGPLAGHLRADPRYRAVYADSVATVFVPADSP